MPNLKLKKLLVKIDANAVRAALLDCEQELRDMDRQRARVLTLAQTYRQLLALNDEDAPVQPPQSLVERFRDLTMANAAHAILSEHVGPMHGRAILAAMAAGGRPITGKQPMSSLQSAMLRDPRFERVKGRINYWRIVATDKQTETG
jgi:hypothetical protein